MTTTTKAKTKYEEEHLSAGQLRALVLLQARVRGALVRELHLVNATNLATTAELKFSENAVHKSLSVGASEAINTLQDPLQSFLTKHGLARYYTRLEKSPFKTLESLQKPDLTDDFLTGFVGMKKFHLIKFRHANAELKAASTSTSTH